MQDDEQIITLTRKQLRRLLVDNSCSLSNKLIPYVLKQYLQLVLTNLKNPKFEGTPTTQADEYVKQGALGALKYSVDVVETVIMTIDRGDLDVIEDDVRNQARKAVERMNMDDLLW